MQKKPVWRVKISPKARKGYLRLDRTVQLMIDAFMDGKVCPNPKAYGSFLTGKFKKVWRYKVGDYRILCYHHQDVLEVLAIKIGHRKDVYKRL